MSNQQAEISPDLKDQVIVMWVVAYHQDVDCVYTFFDWQKVLQGVEGSIRTYVDYDDSTTDEFIAVLMDNLKDADRRCVIPITLNLADRKDFVITIYRWEIDTHTPLFRVLSKCYEQVDQATKIDIMALLSNPR